jgi:PDZ domain-containing secreted protein
LQSYSTYRRRSHFAGQQVTISFWAKADATKNIAVDLAQTFGNGGSPSAAVVGIGVTKVSIGTSWQKVTVTANVPSISGKTLGTITIAF